MSTATLEQPQTQSQSFEMDDLPIESATPLIDEMLTRPVAVSEVFQVAQPVTVQRNLAQVERALLQEARLAGDDFFYGWGAGKDKIEGASIKLANSAARCWGNCVVKPGPIQDLPDSWVFTSYFIDLETGFTMGRSYRMSKKWIVYGRHDEARKEDIRFAMDQSKANRNVILNSLPQFLIDRALRAAHEGATEKIKKWVDKNGIVAATDQAIERFAKLGVVEERVVKRLGLADKKGITTEHLVILMSDMKEIDEGRARIDDIFIPEPKADDVKKRLNGSTGKGKLPGMESGGGAESK